MNGFQVTGKSPVGEGKMDGHMRKLLVASLVGCTLFLTHAESARAQRVITPGEVLIYGTEAVQKYVGERGEVKDPRWVEALLGALRAVNTVAEFGEFERLYLVNDDSINAFAFPPGYIVVHSGLLRAIFEYAQQHHPDRAAEQAAMMISAVLAHELAHLKRGHSYQSMLSVLQGAPRIQFERGQEMEADLQAAFYLVNSGFGLEGMRETFELFDSMTPARMASYRATHQIPADRLANILEYESKLLRYQNYYNEAVDVIANTSDPDALMGAVRVLRAILADLPVLEGELHHAIATAMFKAWYMTARPSELQLQPDFDFYSVRMRELTRRGAGDPKLLEAAKQLLTAVVERHPGSYLSRAELAVLQAYSGEFESAAKMIKAALKTEPKHHMLWNNAGVVLYLAGNKKNAKQAFELARTHAEQRGWRDYPEALYNLAYLEARAGNQAAAKSLRGHYARYDKGSAWLAQLDNALLGGSLVNAAVGISLGMTPQEAVAVLGRTSEIEEKEGYVWVHYRDRGVSLLFGAGEGGGARVSAIFLYGPCAETVKGVRLGMSWTEAKSVLGAPLRTAAGGWQIYAGDHGFNVRLGTSASAPGQQVVVGIVVVPAA